MGLLVGQAVYGEEDKGHALLAASPLATPVAADIVYQMDIQGTVPPGLDWAPFHAGFAHKDWYVFSRTARARTGRQGMVSSRAIVVTRDNIARLDNLAAIFAALDRPAAGDIDDVEIDQNGNSPEANLGLAIALLEGGSPPIVWPAQEGFEPAIAGLWYNLWPNARFGLSFRLAFSPNDVAGREPSIVTTPSQMVQRWTGHRIVDPKATCGDEAAALLAGKQDGGSLRKLIAAIDAQLTGAADLRIVLDLAHALDDEGTTADIIQALRLLCHVSPGCEAGAEQKACLADLCAQRLLGATATEIRMTRNLDLTAIRDPAPVWSAVRQWSASSLLTSNKRDSVTRILREALIDDTAVQPWRSAVRAGLSDALGALKPVAPSLWRILVTDPNLLAPVLGIRPSDRRVEKVLADAVSASFDNQDGDQLLKAAARAGAIQLHAACCAGLLPAPEAIDRHIAESTPNAASFDRILARASGAQRLAIALAHDEPHLVEAGVAACRQKPALLNAIDLSAEHARRLWRLTVEQQPDAWKGPRHARKAFARLLDKMLDDGLRDDGLLSVLAGTPLANLLDHARRADLWAILPRAATGRYLSATAEGWNRAFIAAPDDQPPEEALTTELLKPEHYQPALARLAAHPGQGARYFRTFSGLPQTAFLHWLSDILRLHLSLDAVDAEALGRIIAARSWRDAAYYLADIVLGGRTDLRPAVVFCAELLTWWQRYRLDLFGATPATVKWRTLEEVTIDLYGYGPRDKGIWERAGGKAKDVPKGETGADIWHKIFADAERGKRVIDMGRLVATMASEYPRHDTLDKMRYDSFYW